MMPMMPVTSTRQTHDCLRAGNQPVRGLGSGQRKVLTSTYRKHRAVEFRKFLTQIDAEVPAELDVHRVLDNCGTHTKPRSSSWAAASAHRLAGGLLWLVRWSSSRVPPSAASAGWRGWPAAAVEKATDVGSRNQARGQNVAALLRGLDTSEVTYRSEAHSLAQLQGLTARIAKDGHALASEGVPLSVWGPDITTNRVSVSLTKRSERARSILDRRYESELLSVSMKPVPLARRTVDRYTDVSPYFAGDLIFRPVGGGYYEECTGGPNVTTQSGGTSYMITAAHCGPLNVTWYTNLDQEQTVGPENHRSFSNNGLDVALIKAPTAPWMWGNSTTYEVAGEVYPAKGTTVCYNGAITGLVCGVGVQKTDTCVTFGDGVAACHLTQFTKSSTTVCRPGDSGGPAGRVNKPASGQVLMAGSIVGANGTGETCWYQRIDATESAFNVKLQTG